MRDFSVSVLYFFAESLSSLSARLRSVMSRHSVRIRRVPPMSTAVAFSSTGVTTPSFPI